MRWGFNLVQVETLQLVLKLLAAATSFKIRDQCWTHFACPAICSLSLCTLLIPLAHRDLLWQMHIRVPCISTSPSSLSGQQGIWAWVWHMWVLDFWYIHCPGGTRSWTLPGLTLMQLSWLCRKTSKFSSLKCPDEEEITSEDCWGLLCLPVCQETAPENPWSLRGTASLQAAHLSGLYFVFFFIFLPYVVL